MQSRLLPAINRSADIRSELWLVIRQEGYDWRIVESQPTVLKAERARDIMQSHSDNLGYKEVYKVIERENNGQ